MTELIVRAQLNDHRVIEDLLAPNTGLRLFAERPIINRLVADSYVAEDRPGLGKAAQAAGVPFLVDPNTALLRTPVAPDDRWCRLPYATAAACAPDELGIPSVVAQTVEFQIEHGATTVVPPYLYVTSPDDPAFEVSLRFIEHTADHLREQGIALPITIIAPFRLQGFAAPAAWTGGIDRWVQAGIDVRAETFGLSPSPLGKLNDNLGKVARAFDLSSHLLGMSNRPNLIAWRQGFYGPALVAAGFGGYETGIGQGELTDMAARAASRRTKKKGKPFGASGVFIAALNRSVGRASGRVLLDDRHLGAQLLCDVPGCCATLQDTIARGRHHAVKARAAKLAALDAQPSAVWRLNDIMTSAGLARSVAIRANKVLESSGQKFRLNPDIYASLQAVVENLLRNAREAA